MLGDQFHLADNGDYFREMERAQLLDKSNIVFCDFGMIEIGVVIKFNCLVLDEVDQEQTMVFIA